MILDILKDSFEYSFKDKIVYVKLVILSLLNFLIIPFFFTQGYSYRITKIGIKSMINSDDPLPKFNNWGKMFIEGVKVFIVSLVYSIPSMILAYFLFTTDYLINFSTELNTIHLNTGFGFIVFIIIIWFISFLLSSVGIAHMIANKGSLKAAFHLKDIFRIIKFVGISEYIKFGISYLVIVIGILFILFFISEAFINLGSIISLLILNQQAWIFTNEPINIVLLVGLFSFIMHPFLNIVRSRAIALLYNMTGCKFVKTE